MTVAHFPLMATGMVVSHHAESHGVYVMLRSGQMPTQPVKVGSDGPADGLRFHQEELPTRGTWGLIAFPNNDPRNGIWVKSLYTQLQDAITSASDEPFTHYLSEWSGYWELRDQAGNETRVFPDGTSITISDTGEIPTTYRHVVNADQTQSRVELTQQERVPNPPSPKYINIETASGVSVVITPNGTITVNTPSTATLTASSWTFNGPVTWNGNMQVNGTIQGSKSISDYNGAYGDINLIRSTYDSHTHPTPNGTSGVPNQQLAD